VGHGGARGRRRGRLEPQASFSQYLAAVKHSVLDAYEHNQCTLGEILKYLQVPRNASRPPLVEVIFNVDRDPASAEFAGTEFACERNPKRALHFDLFLTSAKGPAGLYVECDYNTGLFDESTMERWLGHYHTLLQGIVASSGESVENLPLLTSTERRRLIEEWNQNAQDLPAGNLLPQ